MLMHGACSHTHTGRSQLTDKLPPPSIPIGTYDTGDGYYEPWSGKVFSYVKEFLREAGWSLTRPLPCYGLSFM